MSVFQTGGCPVKPFEIAGLLFVVLVWLVLAGLFVMVWVFGGWFDEMAGW